MKIRHNTTNIMNWWYLIARMSVLWLGHSRSNLSNIHWWCFRLLVGVQNEVTQHRDCCKAPNGHFHGTLRHFPTLVKYVCRMLLSCRRRRTLFHCFSFCHFYFLFLNLTNYIYLYSDSDLLVCRIQYETVLRCWFMDFGGRKRRRWEWWQGIEGEK